MSSWNKARRKKYSAASLPSVRCSTASVLSSWRARSSRVAAAPGSGSDQRLPCGTRDES